MIVMNHKSMLSDVESNDGFVIERVLIMAILIV